MAGKFCEETLNTQFQSTVAIMLIDKWCCSKLMATQKHQYCKQLLICTF